MVANSSRTQCIKTSLALQRNLHICVISCKMSWPHDVIEFSLYDGWTLECNSISSGEFVFLEIHNYQPPVALVITIPCWHRKDITTVSQIYNEGVSISIRQSTLMHQIVPTILAVWHLVRSDHVSIFEVFMRVMWQQICRVTVNIVLELIITIINKMRPRCVSSLPRLSPGWW